MQEILQQLGYLEKMTFSLSNHAVTFHLQRWPGEDFSHEIFGLGIILSPPLNASNLLNWYLQLQVTVFFLMMGSSHVESKVWKKHSFVEKIKDAPAAHLKKKQAHGVCVKRNPGDLDMGNKKFRCWANKKNIDIQPNPQMVFSIWRWVSVGLICGEHAPW